MVSGRRAGKVLPLACLLVLLAAGCSVVRGTITTVRALDKAGFSSARIDPRGSNVYAVSVRKDAEDLDAAAEEAAGVVWRNLPARVERLEVTCGNGFGGRGTFAADRAQLEQRFGPRDPALDRGVEDSDLRTAALVLAGLLAFGLVVLVGGGVLIFVLVRRNRRRQPPGGPPAPGPPGPTGWGTQPPPPGYGPRP